MSKIYDGYGNEVSVLSVFTTSLKLTLNPANWNNGTVCAATVEGMTADKTVYVSPAVESISNYTKHGMYCSAQAENTLTFVATSTPTEMIYINVMYF